MKISLNWLKQYVRVYASIGELERAVTFLGFEVEGVVSTGAPKLDHVVAEPVEGNFHGEVFKRKDAKTLRSEERTDGGSELCVFALNSVVQANCFRKRTSFW